MSDSLPLPADVLSEVFFFLDRPSLARCARVNSSFYVLSIPLLYRSITIDQDRDTDRQMAYFQQNRSRFKSGELTPESAPWILMRVLSSEARPRLSLTLRDLVRHVDLPSHQISTCMGTGNALPSLPNLRSVRITLHQSSILQGVQYFTHHPWDFSACSALEEVQIPKLVVRCAPLLYARMSQNLAPKVALARTEEVVLCLWPDQAVVGTNMKYESTACGFNGILRAIPPSTRHLTLVFWTDPTNDEIGPGAVWRPSPRPRRDGEGTVLETSWVGRFFDQLARFAKTSEMRFTIVNVGSVDPTAVLEREDEDHGALHVQDVVEEYVRRYVGEEKVRLVEMRKYMRSPEAEGVFDEDEYRLWV